MRGKLFIASIIVFVIAGIFLFQNNRHIDFISGCIFPTGSKKEYRESLLYEYDHDPGWNPLTKINLSLQPEIVGLSGLLIDINSDNILYQKESFDKRSVASLVKIMTAVIALEHAPLDENITVSTEAASIGENFMGISAGETYSLEELLYGLILPSGNDAAYAIAEGVAGDVETFVDWMNIKARRLGLRDTKFFDPSGLDNATYSTAFDLAKLTRYALRNPDFRRIVATFEKEIYGEDHKYIYLQNQTNLLTTYPGVAGVKTGFTEEAGLCLITYAKNEDRELVGVVLNSIDRKGDMIRMLDWGYKNLGINITHNLF